MVVIGTNSPVSFAIRPDPDFEKIFDHTAAHGVSLVSEDTIAELFDMMIRAKFRKYFPLDQCIDYVEWYAGISEQVIVTEHVVPAVIRKMTDFFPSLCQEKADCIMAGDHHLFNMGKFIDIPVDRPAEFMRLFIKWTRFP